MKIAIIGAGIAGIIAEGACLKTFGDDIAVFDSKPNKGLSSSHKAVMRLRSDSIKDYVNCSLEKIKVQKGVFHDGELHTTPSLLLNNLYSMKVYGTLGYRSLSSLGTVDRYLISNIRPKNTNYIREKVVGVSNKQLILESGSTYNYDICISTMPMPVMIKILNKDYGDIFSYKQIYVADIDLNIKSSVHQTIYFTKIGDPYRATIQYDKMMIESLEDGITNMSLNGVMSSFGLSFKNIKSEKIIFNEQKFGKIEPIEDSLRRRILMDLTDEYSIYSLGRFATWRSLRVDQVVEDIKKIIMLIKVKHRSYYIDHGE